MTAATKSTVAVLGASGTVGRLIVARLLADGYAVRGQTRDADKLAGLCKGIAVHAFDPRDARTMADFVAGADAVIFALGTDRAGATNLFSDVTAALLPAMRAHGVRRLIAITGVGAGDTRGHGGWLYDRIIFPLFTRHRYQDKDRQEALIAAADLDWTIVRPAPFNDRPAPGPLDVITAIEPDTRLTRITRDEVAAFVVDQLSDTQYLRARPFIGHA